MPRTTDAAVEGIIEVDDEISLTPFIETANQLVTDCCVTDTGYTDEKLELIERWLSAHFYAIRDPRASSEYAASIGQTYTLNHGRGLAATQYGQNSMRLDTAGGLAALDKATERGAQGMAMKYVGSNTTPTDCTC